MIKREYNDEPILIIGCGNKYHDHSDDYTINYDINSKPDMVAKFGVDNITLFFPKHTFNEIQIEIRLELYLKIINDLLYLLDPQNGKVHIHILDEPTKIYSFEDLKLLKNSQEESCKKVSAKLNHCLKYNNTYIEEILEKYYKDVEWYGWQEEIFSLIKTKPDERIINWYWNKEGNSGKSFLAKYLVLKYDAIFSDGKEYVFKQIENWINKQNKSPKVVIFDCPRYNKEYINYGMLEEIKNGMIYSNINERGVCLFNNPHVIVFASFQPDIEKMSWDRWNIRKICLKN